MYFPQIPDAIGPHTSPLDPIKLPYTIRVDEEFHEDPSPTIYDIRVAVEDPLRTKMLALTQNPHYASGLRQIALLDDQLALIIQALTHSRARHAFFTALSKDPATFLRRWINSQRRIWRPSWAKPRGVVARMVVDPSSDAEVRIALGTRLLPGRQ